MNICQLIRNWIHIDLSRSPVRNDNHSHVHVDTCMYKYITGYLMISVLVYVITVISAGNHSGWQAQMSALNIYSTVNNIYLL